MNDIVIFGGTFDPVHKGHTNLLETVLKEMSPDRVIVMPAKIPPHKQASGLATEQDRLNMCRLAFSGYEKAEVSDHEIKSRGRSYSYYTVSFFKEKFPEKDLWFVVGSDMLLSFEEWFRYKDILGMCGLLCVSREKGDEGKLAAMAEKLSSLGKVKILSCEPMEVSSTGIRQLLKEGGDVSNYLDSAVINYIKDKKIYK